LHKSAQYVSALANYLLHRPPGNVID